MPPEYVLSEDLGRKLCSILGLTHVIKLRLILHPGEFARVSIERFLTPDEAKEFGKVLEEYRLVKKEPAKQETPNEHL